MTLRCLKPQILAPNISIEPSDYTVVEYNNLRRRGCYVEFPAGVVTVEAAIELAVEHPDQWELRA